MVLTARNILRPLGVVVLASMVLASCATDYRNIRPRHEVHNAPIPVPWPRIKPKPPPKVISRPARSVVAPAKTSGGGTHVVRKGDTVFAVARRYGVEVRDVITTNRLRPPYVLLLGQRLKVPGSGQHIVARGDTAYSISRRYGIDQRTLARMNGLKPPYTLSIGQRLKLPAGVGGTNTASDSARKDPIPPPPPRQSSRFMWPVKGKVLSGFGPKGGGLHNDGINIQAGPGAAVRAADSGVVAYAGNELKGFGNLLLVRHSGGWVTAYAHNQALLVKRGETVKRGQVIGRAGSTGAVERPQVHFEIRKGSAAVDPQKYLAQP